MSLITGRNQKAYRIDKETFYARGGFANPEQYRASHGSTWVYYSYQ